MRSPRGQQPIGTCRRHDSVDAQPIGGCTRKGTVAFSIHASLKMTTGATLDLHAELLREQGFRVDVYCLSRALETMSHHSPDWFISIAPSSSIFNIATARGLAL